MTSTNAAINKGIEVGTEISTPIGKAIVETITKKYTMPQDILYSIFPEDPNNNKNKGKEPGYMFERLNALRAYRNPNSAVYVVYTVNYENPIKINNAIEVTNNYIEGVLKNSESTNNVIEATINDNTNNVIEAKVITNDKPVQVTNDYLYRSGIYRSPYYLFDLEIRPCTHTVHTKWCEFEEIMEKPIYKSKKVSNKPVHTQPIPNQTVPKSNPAQKTTKPESLTNTRNTSTSNTREAFVGGRKTRRRKRPRKSRRNKRKTKRH